MFTNIHNGKDLEYFGLIEPYNNIIKAYNLYMNMYRLAALWLWQINPWHRSWRRSLKSLHWHWSHCQQSCTAQDTHVIPNLLFRRILCGSMYSDNPTSNTFYVKIGVKSRYIAYLTTTPPHHVFWTGSTLRMRQQTTHRKATPEVEGEWSHEDYVYQQSFYISNPDLCNIT